MGAHCYCIKRQLHYFAAIHVLSAERFRFKMDEEDAFRRAADHLETLISTLPESSKENDLLYLYARYKQATAGPCNITKPSFFNMSARKKWSYWNDLHDMEKDQAMREYVKKIRTLDPSWDPQTSKVRSGMGVCVSTLNCNDEIALSDQEKSIFDWCKEGSVEMVSHLLTYPPPKDDEGRTLLHWACDRGHRALVQYLIDQNHDVNCQDIDLLTPLHYASSCDHHDIVHLLLKNKADSLKKDADGETALDCAASEKIICLLEEFTL